MAGFFTVDCEQRSEEWYAARVGRVTGSRAADAIAVTKAGKEAAAQRDYRIELAVERMTGLPVEDFYVTRDMQRGIDLEPFALAKYEADVGKMVRKVGFIYRGDLMIGSSPDGLVDGSRGAVECKCPKSATHVGYLRAGVVPEDYVPQCLHLMWVGGLQWIDFVSFDDRLPAGLDYFRVRMHRDEARMAQHTIQIKSFLETVEREEAALRELRAAHTQLVSVA